MISGSKSVFRLIFRLLLGLELVVIALFSLLPDPPRPELDFRFLDKLEHALAYLVLSATALLAFRSARGRFLPAVGIIMSCTLFGGLIEILQFFTGRTPDSMDLLADLGGSLGGVVVAAFWSGRRTPVKE